MLTFLRKRDPDQPFWHWVLTRQRDGVPPALLELVRDDQVVISSDEAKRSLAFVRDAGFRDDEAGTGRTPVEVVDADGRPVDLGER